MGVTLEFKDKKTGERAHLGQEVDPAIARHMEVECDDNKWTLSWYQSIAVLMAIGKKGEELRKEIRTGWGSMPERMEELLKITDFIEDTYEVHAWR